MIRWFFTPRYSPAFVLAIFGCGLLYPLIGLWSAALAFGLGFIVAALEDLVQHIHANKALALEMADADRRRAQTRVRT